MTSTFSSKKASKISKRKLGMESLENREMLSVNPLGVDTEAAPDFVQAPAAASQDFGTEAAGNITNAAASATKAGTDKSDTKYTVAVTPSGGAADDTYDVFYGITDSTGIVWTDVATWTKLGATVTVNGTGTTPVNSDELAASSLTYTDGSKIFFALAPSGTAASAVSGSNSEAASGAAHGSTLPANPVSNNATSNATVSVSGVTTSAATLTWTKPTTFGANNDKVGKVITYHVTVGGKTYDTTKTTYTVTGLTGTPTYTITAEIEDADKVKHTVAIGTAASPITLVGVGTAAAVTVGAPTEVKAAYAKASSGKPASVKVTWKAPANYTGGYTVTLHNVADGTTTTNDIVQTILPGAKLEKVFEVAATATTDKLGNDLRYSVVVTPKVVASGTSIASTPTYVNVGTVTVAGAAPDVPALPVTAGLTGVPGGTTVTLAKGTSTGSEPVPAGYYVGLGATLPATAPSAADLAKLVYVAANATGDATVNLKPAATDKVYAYAVGTDGTLSAGAISAAIATVEPDAAATDTTNVYPPANDAKTVTATADATAKNKVTVKWTAATDYTNYSGTGDTTTSDFKYTVAGYRVTATLSGGASLVQVILKADQSKGAAFAGLQYGAKYDFKVETLVDYAIGTVTDDNTWGTAVSNVSTGPAKASVTIAKAPTVADIAKTAIAEKTNTGVGATVEFTGAANTSYKVTVTDANKAVLYENVVAVTTAGPQTITLDTSTTGALTPGAKYTVTVQTFGSVPGTISKGVSVTVTATPFVTGTVKDAKATTINSVKLTVAAPAKGASANDADKYYVEYTNVVDAKGKPDWNAAKVYDNDTGSPVAVTKDVTISHLTPGSQYYFRVVTTDAAYGTNWSSVKKSVAGKEIKVKTVAVPLATISKTGFVLYGSSKLCLDFSGKSMLQVDKAAATAKQLLTGTDLAAIANYKYKLIVSTDSKVDKGTGKLLGSAVISPTITDALVAGTKGDYKVDNLAVTPIDFTTIFDALSKDNTNYSGIKGLSIQLEVSYDGGNVTEDAFVSYSKVAKVALPKWFV